MRAVHFRGEKSQIDGFTPLGFFTKRSRSRRSVAAGCLEESYFRDHFVCNTSDVSL